MATANGAAVAQTPVAFHGMSAYVMRDPGTPADGDEFATVPMGRKGALELRAWPGNSPGQAILRVAEGARELLAPTAIGTHTGVCRVSTRSVVVALPQHSITLVFANGSDAEAFIAWVLQRVRGGAAVADGAAGGAAPSSHFSAKTDATSASQYFHYYGQLLQQQNMLQDLVRTGTYQRAVLENWPDFSGKVVLDVGAGTGILSFFAAQAGARRVYAVEASAMADNTRVLAEGNGFGARVVVLRGKIEEIELPELVDVIISEPMGTMLVNERMLESFVHARKFLRPGGIMFPSTATLFCAPFTDEYLYIEQFNKTAFWHQRAFFGLNMTSLCERATVETFSQPVVDALDPRLVVAPPILRHFDFLTMPESDLHKIHLPFTFRPLGACNVHGLAFWFDVAFKGSQSQVILSTAPTAPLTHWYQLRCLFREPIFMEPGRTISGSVAMNVNTRQSYDIRIDACADGTSLRASNVINLKEPYYRFSGYTPPVGAVMPTRGGPEDDMSLGMPGGLVDGTFPAQ